MKRTLAIGFVIAGTAIGVIWAARPRPHAAAPLSSSALVASAPPPAGSEASAAIPAGPAELALVAPVVSGRRLVDGWTVRDIRGVEGGTFRLDLAEDAGHGRVLLHVALASDEGPPPPAEAGRYAIFYSAREVSSDVAERLAQSLAKVIEKNRAAPEPPGMTAFRPRPKRPEPL